MLPDSPQHLPLAWHRPVAHCAFALDAVHFGTHPSAPPSSTSQMVSGFVHVEPAVEQPFKHTVCD